MDRQSASPCDTLAERYHALLDVAQAFPRTETCTNSFKITQIRWFVILERPANTEQLNEAQLAALVTPEAIMGVALVSPLQAT